MRIEEIASNVQYQKDEQFQNLTIFWESSEFWKFRKLSNFYNWNFFKFIN